MTEARFETQVPIYPPGSYIAGRFHVLQSPPFDPDTRRFVSHAEIGAGKPFAGNPHLAGGMGMVYQCVDLARNGEPVALKTFQPHLLSNRAARDRFLKEATVWTELGSHPHLVRAQEVSYVGDGREVYLVLAWIEPAEGLPDASLRTWLRQGKVTGREAVRLLFQATQGMARAVERVPGLVHGDLTTGNLLVGRDGNLRVTDFGLARAGADEETVPGAASGESAGRLALLQLTGGTGRLMGTPGYMAPEQDRGESLDGQADRYAFGVILAEVLAVTEMRGTGLPPEEAVPVLALAELCRATERTARPSCWQAILAALTTACPSLGESLAEARPADVSREEQIALGWSYNAVGLSYRSLAEFRKAAEYFEHVLALGRATGERKLEGAGLANLGNACLDLGEYRRAIGLCEQFLTLAAEINDQRGRAKVLGNLGIAYEHVSEYLRAISLYEHGLMLARELGDRQVEANALGSLGNAYLRLGQYHRSIEFYEQFQSLARELGNRNAEAKALGSLGTAYRALREHRRAIALFEQRLVLARELGDRKGEANALGNLGNVYQSLGENDRAIGFCQQHVTLARELGDRNGEMNALGNLGNAYRGLGQNQLGVELYEQCLAIARELGDRQGEAVTRINLAHRLAGQGRANAAVSHVEWAIVLFEVMGHAAYAADARQLLAHLSGEPTSSWAGVMPTQADFDQAIQALLCARSEGELRADAGQLSLLKSPAFAASIAMSLDRAQPEIRAQLEPRLEWLRRLAED